MVMASAGVNVPGAGGSGDGIGNPTAGSAANSDEWRVGRRRRLERQGSAGDASQSWVRRLRPAASRSSPSPSPSQGPEEADDPDVQEMESPPAPAARQLQQQQPGAPEPEPAVAAPAPVPATAVPNAAAAVAFGSVSVSGRMRIMEDTVSLHPNLCTWPFDASPVHFFGVFDGHGGSQVSSLCRDRMHECLAEELLKEGASFMRRRQAALSAPGDVAESSAAGAMRRPGSAGGWSDQAEEERAWHAALLRAFRRVDAQVALACACGRMSIPRCRCSLSRSRSARGVAAAAGIVGSTAVVALLVRGRLVVANCGDSRAVLCRGPAGTPPVPLSFDHKPNRADEWARIEAAGGRVLYNNGYRVRGILAMSRAIGDRFLRPEVIAEPEITITERTGEDQCLILASDGMWDVMSNDIACHVARECLEDWNPPPADAAAAASASAAGGGAPAAGVVFGQESERCACAASLLARLAMGRETHDNISIVVIDLKRRE